MIIGLEKGQRTVDYDVHNMVSCISVVLDDTQNETYALV